LSEQASIHEEDEWLEQPPELPPRPRRRLLGPGANRTAVGLLAVLLVVCGFIGGVLVEKGESSGSSSAGATAGGLASGFAALRAGASGTGSRSAGGASGRGGVVGLGGAGSSRPTTGTVAYLAGSTLYVTDPEGNTVKVKTSEATSVTKTAKASVDAIHPGETVTVMGASGTGGAIAAESISVGSPTGALASLFAGSASSSGSGSGSGASGTPSLFGSG
jgi:hypothetical protein